MSAAPTQEGVGGRRPPVSPEREREAQTIARQVHDYVDSIAPPGIAGNEGVWALVQEQDDRFTRFLYSFERGYATRETLLEAGRELMRAWKQAVRMYLELST